MVQLPLVHDSGRQQTVRVTSSSARRQSDAEPVISKDWVRTVRSVLFDFDGPICSLFAAQDTHSIAAQVRKELAAGGISVESYLQQTNAHTILRDVCLTRADDFTAPAIGRAGMVLTDFELASVATAEPTEHAAALIRLLHSPPLRLSLAVASNNSGEAIRAYLHRHDMLRVFEGRIHGRDHGSPALMKPDPSCVRAAVDSLPECDRENCILIGDSVFDGEAASKADVTFVGFVPPKAEEPDRHRDRLRRAGAAFVVMDLSLLVDAFTP